ncbi:MAG: FkbM family methyltransferase [Pseudomonadota bacterium]
MTAHISKSSDKDPGSPTSISVEARAAKACKRISYQVTQYSAPRLLTQIMQWLCARYINKVTTWLHRCLPVSVRLPSGFAFDPHDHIGSRVLASGIYESREIQAAAWLLSKFDSASGVMVDVGAHIGVYSCVLCRYFKRVIAFEPNPRVFMLLQYNCFNLHNVDFRQVALADSQSTEYLGVDRCNTGHAELGGGNTSNFSEMDVYFVPTDTLDAQLVSLDIPVRFIKIDVEGEECRVIRGAEKILKRDRPIISFEYVQEFQADNDINVYDFLISYDYRIFVVEHRHLSKYEILNALHRLIVSPELNMVELIERPQLDSRLLFAVPSELVVNLEEIEKNGLDKVARA